MNLTDRECEKICVIEANDKTRYLLQKVINKSGDIMYTLCPEDNPDFEIYSSHEDQLGSLFEHIVECKLATGEE